GSEPPMEPLAMVNVIWPFITTDWPPTDSAQLLMLTLSESPGPMPLGLATLPLIVIVPPRLHASVSLIDTPAGRCAAAKFCAARRAVSATSCMSVAPAPASTCTPTGSAAPLVADVLCAASIALAATGLALLSVMATDCGPDATRP